MRTIHPIGAAALLCLLPAAAAAQAPLSFPLDLAGTDPGTGLTVLEPRGHEIAALMAHDRVLLRGFPAGVRSVDLDLRRVDLDRRKFGFQVNGEERPDLLDGLDLSVWTGQVVGEPDSDVVLSFSNRGSRGWVRTAGEFVHLMPQPRQDGAVQDWSRSYALLARESELAALGIRDDRSCGLDQLLAPPQRRAPAGPAAPPAPGAGGTADGSGDCLVREAKVAVETDFQMFQMFGDLGAVTAYTTSLLAAVSDRYEEQVDAVLTYPYLQFYTTSNDPWSTPESGGSMIDMLNEFAPAWQGNIPGDALLGHFVSGAGLGGGVANVGVLCDTSETFTFAVSGSLNGNLSLIHI